MENSLKIFVANNKATVKLPDTEQQYPTHNIFGRPLPMVECYCGNLVYTDDYYCSHCYYLDNMF